MIVLPISMSITMMMMIPLNKKNARFPSSNHPNP